MLDTSVGQGRFCPHQPREAAAHNGLRLFFLAGETHTGPRCIAFYACLLHNISAKLPHTIGDFFRFMHILPRRIPTKSMLMENRDFIVALPLYLLGFMISMKSWRVIQGVMLNR